jgi:hypothetical protein
MDEHNLTDIWRDANRTAVKFTHFSTSANSGARLDRILLNRSFLTSFNSIESNLIPAASIASDHCPVSLCFRATSPAVPRGTGILGFPLPLLNMPEAAKELLGIIHTLSAPVHIDPSPVKWANFKCLVRDASVRIYRDHRHLRQVATTQANCPSMPRLLRQTEAAAASLAASDAVVKAYRALLDPEELAGKILDHHFGDRSTYYFFQGTKPPLDPVVITAINRPGRAPGEELATADLRHPAGRDLGLQYATSFFSSDSPMACSALARWTWLPRLKSSEQQPATVPSAAG